MTIHSPVTNNSGSNGLSMAIATLVTSLLSKKLSLDPTLYGVLFTVTDQAIKYGMESKFDFTMPNLINTKMISFISILMVVGYVLFLNYNLLTATIKKKILSRSKYITLKMYTYNDMNTFIEYSNKNPSFYSKPIKMDFGDVRLLTDSNNLGLSGQIAERSFIKKASDEIEIHFNDTNFNVKGFYRWLKEDLSVDKTVGKDKEVIQTKLHVPYIELNIESKCTKDIQKYYDDMCDYLKKINGKNQILYANKMIVDKVKEGNNPLKYICTEYHNEPKKSLEEMEKLYIDSFFHHEKEKYWNLLKQIHFKPDEFIKLGQVPSLGLLLHGPPGTGKSNWAYRIAVTLGRHIISLDMRAIKNRGTIFQIMKNPYIYNSGLNVKPKDVVFIFDEFDLTVKELYFKEQRTEKIMENWSKSAMKYFESSSSCDISKEKKEDDDKDDKVKTSSMVSLDSHGYDQSELSMNDLLELFQGPVPNPGSIIIATTNKYDDLKKWCPALVRPGRLTPIHFGYPDSEIINQICQFYFGETIKIAKSYVATISTSKIMELALDAKLDPEKGIKYFKKEFEKLISS